MVGVEDNYSFVGRGFNGLGYGHTAVSSKLV